MKWFYKAAAVLVLLGLGAGVKSYFFPASEPMQYLTSPVTRGDIRETVLATGTLTAFKQVSVGAQASGQVNSLHVELGDTVKEGDLIAEIDAQSQENSLAIAEADLEKIKAQRAAKVATLQQAQSEFTRQKNMLKSKATSRQDYENAQATLAETKADIAALDAQIVAATIDVDTAKVDLGYTKITAPMDGVVVAVITKKGQTVNASQSTPTIVKLAQLDTMTVEAEVSEADVIRVKPGQKVYFTILGEPDNRYEATLRSIEPAPDSIAGDDDGTTTSSSDEAIYYNALFDVANPDHKLRISMTAEVTIVLDEAKDVLLIPESALGAKDGPGTYSVRVLAGDDRVEVRKVRTGLTDSVNIQVLDGVAEGDRVILGESGADAVSGRRRPSMRF
ncbi:efflux RND transporter periplasmic adaptor subunit [Desulfovibrio sp. Huiquan2017]|uniref:efflux RND transporter periplasmic adaptor subunit n=1 Tax=Desulfovibrio sp. Huiquan2017 TaxID=2816861 RepID=UPI001A922BED|nr:efflux RND transporter periplasmic adaptor subunit [Desulfovibrio sp. Huiquan2017]